MSEKKQQILNTALELFYQKGVQVVGINEVISASGVAKKTMYYHFPSKEQLVLSTLELRDSRFISWIEGLLQGSSSGQEAIINLFKGLDLWFNDEVKELGHFKGCFFINVSTEYREPNSAIFQFCCQHKRKVLSLIQQQAERFVTDNAEQFVELIGVIKEGCITSAVVQQDKKAAAKMLPVVKGLLDKFS